MIHQQVPPPVIAIFGPTGTGKTAAAVELALRFNGEVVNADSRYLYRHLAIGVAKPTLDERKGVRHHLIDICDPTDVITIAEVQQQAYQAFAGITTAGKLPILAGGTPLYMNAITEGWQMPEVAPDWEFRTRMEATAAERGADWLADQVRAIDPAVADRSAGNVRRLIRALEVHRATGVPMSHLESRTPPPYTMLNVALTQPRDVLYARLDARIDAQIAGGWVDEVRGLLAMGLDGSGPAFTSIGYREIVGLIRGEVNQDQAISRIRHATHRYVRHQMTWLRRKTGLIWFDTSEDGWMSRLEAHAAEFLNQISTSEP